MVLRDLRDPGRELVPRRRLSGAPPDDVWHFIAHGMLYNVTAALGFDPHAME